MPVILACPYCNEVDTYKITERRLQKVWGTPGPEVKYTAFGKNCQGQKRGKK